MTSNWTDSAGRAGLTLGSRTEASAEHQDVQTGGALPLFPRALAVFSSIDLVISVATTTSRLKFLVGKPES